MRSGKPRPTGRGAVTRIFAGEYEIRYELNGQTIYVLRLWHSRENR
ncbi:type II toxin-antitoxin system RelE/ParE family toxin [Salmonella enterica subsp. enterica]|nr:type II toxin-antitoxin system RelE/ParE family toxin [Salmonella enterica subsp. enterica]ECR1918822.1 type II toxin-antitoxin system RelE/ParE family toxin [Salmonella enterica subsp. enterica serovar Johannesburg]